MNDIEKKAYYSCLFAYYSELLTPKQQDLFIYYYNEDYSLAEIANELHISRNAVWDTLKKVINSLEEFENKLGLYQKDLQRDKIYQNLKNHCDDEGKELIKELEEME